MRYRIFLLSFLIAGILLFGCSQLTDSGEISQSTDEITPTSTLGEEISFMADEGVPFGESDGVFNVSWHEMFNPMNNNSLVVGQVMGVVFDETATETQPPRPSGIDIGQLFVNYQGNQVEIPRRETPDGSYVYALLEKPHRPGGPGFGGDRPEGPNGPNGRPHGPGGPGGKGPSGQPEPGLEYVAGIDYQFEITGSANFDPLSFGVTSPPALIEITSHSHGQTIDPAQDLTLTWSGGTGEEKTVVRVNAGRRPGSGPQRPDFPGPDKGIIKILDNNPGQITITSSEIQSLISGSDIPVIICNVTQVSEKEIDHNGKTLMAVIRNSDGVGLRPQE